MGNIKASLFFKDSEDFIRIKEESTSFNYNYNGGNIIQDDIFNIAENYARKKGNNLELITIPIEDEELWAFTFVKCNTIFVCVNSKLPMNKEIFAMAHELFHIYCYIEKDSSLILDCNTVLQEDIMNNVGLCKEDLEANAFAGLLLMPKDTLLSQMDIYDIKRESITVDEVIKLMDIFAMPYRAVVLRLIESDVISKSYGEKLLNVSSEKVLDKIELTGVGKRWQIDGKNRISFGSLLENMKYNEENDVLFESRYNDDESYILEIKNKLNGVK